jgi:hypothetical protein
MFPHEQLLVQEYDRRPFALLGVNLDSRREGLLGTEVKEHLNWRSWWDGANLAIAEQWKVEALPTLFLIDHRGILRFTFNGPPKRGDLEKHIEELLAEAEK